MRVAHGGPPLRAGPAVVTDADGGPELDGVHVGRPATEALVDARADRRAHRPVTMDT
jgi:hypothetical protein